MGNNGERVWSVRRNPPVSHGGPVPAHAHQHLECVVEPEAKRFRRWVTNEVLPAIRKTGAYITDSILDSDDPWTLLARQKPPYSGRFYRQSLERECFAKLRVTNQRSAQTANQAE